MDQFRRMELGAVPPVHLELQPHPLGQSLCVVVDDHVPDVLTWRFRDA